MPVHSQRFGVLAPLEQIPTCSYLLSISDSILSLLLFPFKKKKSWHAQLLHPGLCSCRNASVQRRLKRISSNNRSLPWRDAPLRGGRSCGRRATLVTDHLTVEAQRTLPCLTPRGFSCPVSEDLGLSPAISHPLSYSTTVAPRGDISACRCTAEYQIKSKT